MISQMFVSQELEAMNSFWESATKSSVGRAAMRALDGFPVDLEIEHLLLLLENPGKTAINIINGGFSFAEWPEEVSRV